MDKLAEIRKLYYETSKSTILHDFDRAIDLLKSMASEEERERATVYMQGLTEMRNQWATAYRSPPSGARPSGVARERSGRSKSRGGRGR